MLLPVSEDFAMQVFQYEMQYGSGGIARVLDRLDLDDADSLVGDELLEGQRDELRDVVAEYRKKKNELDDKAEIGALRFEYGKKIKEILLPSQVDGLNSNGVGMIFQTLRSENPITSYLKLSDAQRRAIERDCSRINEEIRELTRIVEDKTKALREKANNTLLTNLSKDQLEKLERLVRNTKGYFDRHNLKSLDYETRVYSSEEK